MMIGTALPATSVVNVVGAFIKPGGPTVQQYLHAGVLLWFVQTSQNLPLIRIDALVKPHYIHEYIPVTDASMPLPPFFTRSSLSEGKHMAYACFIHKFMGIANHLGMNTVNPRIQIPLSSTAKAHSLTNMPAPATSHGLKGKQPCEIKLANFFPYLTVSHLIHRSKT